MTFGHLTLLLAPRPSEPDTTGRTEGIRYRLLDLDTENEYIDPSEKQYLIGVNEAQEPGLLFCGSRTEGQVYGLQEAITTGYTDKVKEE